MITNPNKPLRAAYIAALSTIGIPVKSKKMPIEQKAQQYIILQSQTKERTEETKDGCLEWLCSIVIDITYYNPSGSANADLNDDIEEQVIDIIEQGISVDGFMVKSTRFIQSTDLSIETPNYTILRRIVTYQHWLAQTESSTENAHFTYTLPFQLS